MKKIYTFALMFAACALVACGGSQPKSNDSDYDDEYKQISEQMETAAEEFAAEADVKAKEFAAKAEVKAEAKVDAEKK